jgi:NAD(P)-dependent dehydrogenase (short-subunit alcohol dehydrogenase family)
MLAGRVVLITGGARGLGAAIVQAAVGAGARVVASDLSFPAPPAHPSVLHVVGDVTKAADRERMLDAAFSRFGALDGLVNNAALNICRPFLDTREEDYDRVVNVGQRAMFFLTQGAVRRARATPGARTLSVVNVSSVHALGGMPGAGPYDAAKAALLGLTRTLAVELAVGAPAVRVNAVSPGACDTEMVRMIFEAAPDRAASWKYWSDNLPQARLVLPKEVADPVVFLLSDGASAITGANLVIDGGMTAKLMSKEPYESKPYES